MAESEYSLSLKLLHAVCLDPDWLRPDDRRLLRRLRWNGKVGRENLETSDNEPCLICPAMLTRWLFTRAYARATLEPLPDPSCVWEAVPCLS